MRIQCAKCHNHPFEHWTQDDYYGFAAFFSQVGRKKGNQPGEEVVYWNHAGDVRQPRTGKVMKPKALGGPGTRGARSDRRVRLASWLTSQENPFFARSLVNRVWFHLMGRGIVEPVDDFRDSNPASNDELLDGLTTRFVKDGYSLKALIRTILRSRTYQLSSHTSELNADDNLYFSHALTKLLPAEVLLDAISTVTGTTTAFEGLPRGPGPRRCPTARWTTRSSRPSAAPPVSWPASASVRVTRTSRRPSSSSVARPSTASSTTTTAGSLSSPRAASHPRHITSELYLVALGRTPTAAELAAATKHLKAGPDLRPPSKTWVGC